MVTTKTRLNPAMQEAVDRASDLLSFSDDEYRAFTEQLETSDHILRELLLCAVDREYFIRQYCKIYDPIAKHWISFALWEAQVEVLNLVIRNQKTVALKARQLGMTWLMLAYGLHEMIFRPIAEILIFSKREDEAIYLLSEERLKGMYRHLPDWMKPGIRVDAAKHFGLLNGSNARAFPSNAGDSYTATFAIIDEADLVSNLNQLLNRVKPTIDAGGKLVMISRVEKAKPQTLFKNIYKAAKQGANEWASVFLAWHVHPGRTQDWYDKQCRDALENEGTLDSVYEQYPATDLEALAARTLDKRFAPKWLKQCYIERQPIPDDALPTTAPAIPGLRVYIPPEKGRKYVIGGDPAEGNPTSDDSAMVVLDRETWEEVAMLSGKYQPSTLAAHMDTVGQWYNNADVMVERNNHGHAVLLWLKDHSTLKRLNGFDNKEGWHSTSKGKALLYDGAAETFKDGEAMVHSFKVYDQLASIEGSSLRAPAGLMDDCSDAFVLALAGARTKPSSVTFRTGKARW